MGTNRLKQDLCLLGKKSILHLSCLLNPRKNKEKEERERTENYSLNIREQLQRSGLYLLDLTVFNFTLLHLCNQKS
jgi:hypothetical protein